MKWYGLSAAFVLLVIVNVVVLAGVRYNHSGEPDAVVELTERELPLAWSGRENSGTALQLDWRRYDEDGPEWFDRRKLTEVGFDCGTAPDAPDADLRYGRALPRKTFVVLEFEGAAWEAWQARARKKLEAMEADITAGKAGRLESAKARKRFAWERVVGSRLFPVDVGNDPKLLRKRYPDRNRCIITPAVVRLRFRSAQREKGKPEKPAAVYGWIEEILTGTIQVPRDRRGLLTKVTSGGRPWKSFYYDEKNEEKPPPAPRYKVVLKYGKRLEPWVTAVLPYGENAKQAKQSESAR
jgi:hypothetical protein